MNVAKCSIVVVNWNAGKQLLECIQSIVDYNNALVTQVVVVDNGSSDGSMKLVEGLRDTPFPLRLVYNDKNLGFGAACNRGATLAESEYVLFLNPDAKLLSGSLGGPLTFMEETANVDVGVVGVQLLDEQGKVARSCARFPTLGMFASQILAIDRLPGMGNFGLHMSEWEHDTTQTVDHVIGAFFLIRRSLFVRVGGFDERFFVYLEDLDLSLRVHQSNFRAVYLANAQAFHAGGGTSRQVKARRLFYSLRSRLYYGFKHFSALQSWILLAITLLIEPLTRSFLAVFRRSASDLFNTWCAYGMLLRDLPRILREARER
ncbi:glycosyltransferase family 2 protein [Rhodanobacter glycinis]|uniref:Glycosyltransferase family 2 protein n=1 Tax=Rhodanobacter glycinis TaxID=582702 RepID=A0A5B9E026_9GAMM|nr:glycosyltransferase family 2 protein [Rhodanobacter glycinis]QEE25643.1 glycosyltransferase family 2 protein [Rhodanobacter glycinis]